MKSVIKFTDRTVVFTLIIIQIICVPLHKDPERKAKCGHLMHLSAGTVKFFNRA